MRSSINKEPKLQYRGSIYQKKATIQCLINLSAERLDRLGKRPQNFALKYRGVAYKIRPQQYSADFSTSVYVQTYRGNSYLTCIANLFKGN